MQHSVAQASTEPVAIASDDHPSDAGKLIVLNHPLEPLPLEVSRIRRGMVKRFTGKFIKDGVTAWSAIDLERLSPSRSSAVFSISVRTSHVRFPIPFFRRWSTWTSRVSGAMASGRKSKS
jgi:hypothetical protein